MPKPIIPESFLKNKGVQKEAVKQFTKEISAEIADVFVNPIIKSAEVKKILQISESKLEALRQNGTLPCIKLGRTYVYQRKDVESLIKFKN